jgi:hypothetical protein
MKLQMFAPWPAAALAVTLSLGCVPERTAQATPSQADAGNPTGHYCNMGVFTPVTLARHQELVKKLTGGKEPHKGVNPDEVVAIGAAVQGAVLSGDVKEWNVPYNAASFAFNAKTDNKAEAMTWIDQSIAMKETFGNLRLKAQMLAADGKTKDAIALGEKAVTVGKADKNPSGDIPIFEKQLAEWKAGK